MNKKTRYRRTVAKHGPHPVEMHVGSRVRLRRTLLGMNQTQLGAALGVTYQQLQKNEHGMNRIGASRLWQLSQVLDVPVSYFFEGLDEGAEAGSSDDVMVKRETLELVRAYYRITDPETRKRLRELVKAIVEPARG